MYEVLASDDILDEQSNPTAQHMQQMINQSTTAHRQQILAQMQRTPQPTVQPAAQQPDYWFVDPATQGVTPQAQPAAQATSTDQAVLDQIQAKKAQSNTQNMREIAPLPAAAQQPIPTPAQPVVDPVKVTQLAQNNDLNISTIARQANKKDDDEVVISLR